MSKELFQKGAFHEAGHALIGYYMGFQIDEIILFESDPGSGCTRFNYGADNLLTAGILNAKKDPSFFNSLPKESRSRAPQATHKICCTLIAGGVAQAIHKQGIEFKGNLEIGFADPDAEGIEACEYVMLMSLIDKESCNNYVYDLVQYITSIIKTKEKWEVINSLAEALLNSPNKTIYKVEIEEIFKKHNFKKNAE